MAYLAAEGSSVTGLALSSVERARGRYRCVQVAGRDIGVKGACETVSASRCAFHDANVTGFCSEAHALVCMPDASFSKKLHYMYIRQVSISCPSRPRISRFPTVTYSSFLSLQCCTTHFLSEDLKLVRLQAQAGAEMIDRGLVDGDNNDDSHRIYRLSVRSKRGS